MAGAKQVDQKLMDFVVELTVNDTFRKQFEDPANREQMMTTAQLQEHAKQAIRLHDNNALERLLNIQIIIPVKAKKAKAAKKKAKKAKKGGKSGRGR
jgi:hypothetical protein